MELSLGFILKKVISALMMPLSFGLFIGFLGLWYLYKNRIKRAKILISVSLAWIALISFHPIANLLITPLEDSYPKLEKRLLSSLPSDTKHILLLGGYPKERAWEVLRLYHLIPNATIITSGYANYLPISQAQLAANFLMDSGVPEQDIVVLDRPKDTKEEAMLIKELLGDNSFVLVTSAYHMPRAIELFKREGLSPIPAPTDYKTQESARVFSVPKGTELRKSEQALHEYLGMLWAKLTSLKT